MEKSNFSSGWSDNEFEYLKSLPEFLGKVIYELGPKTVTAAELARFLSNTLGLKIEIPDKETAEDSVSI
jgi:uncharacterized protein YbjT (DUF2867 family)